jgi:hypothetical protein
MKHEERLRLLQAISDATYLLSRFYKVAQLDDRDRDGAKRALSELDEAVKPLYEEG